MGSQSPLTLTRFTLDRLLMPLLGLSTTGSARVNVNQGLTNKMLRSYGVPCLDDDEEDAMAAGARCGRGAGVAAVRQWRHERSGLPTAACLRESNP
jgi:hypothetical protein